MPPFAKMAPRRFTRMLAGCLPLDLDQPFCAPAPRLLPCADAGLSQPVCPFAMIRVTRRFFVRPLFFHYCNGDVNCPPHCPVAGATSAPVIGRGPWDGSVAALCGVDSLRAPCTQIDRAHPDLRGWTAAKMVATWKRLSHFGVRRGHRSLTCCGGPLGLQVS